MHCTCDAPVSRIAGQECGIRCFSEKSGFVDLTATREKQLIQNRKGRFFGDSVCLEIEDDWLPRFSAGDVAVKRRLFFLPATTLSTESRRTSRVNTGENESPPGASDVFGREKFFFRLWLTNG